MKDSSRRPSPKPPTRHEAIIFRSRGWTGTKLQIICLSVAGIAVALALGYIATKPNGPKVALVLGSILVFVAIFARRPGIAIGLLVLGTQNGLPFVNTATTYITGLALGDYIAYALVAVLLIHWIKSKRPTEVQAGLRGLTLLGVGLAVWWFITLERSTAAGVPVTIAAAFGRNFLFFAVLVALFPVSLRARRCRKDALLTLCAGALIYSVGEIIITTSHVQLSWLVHPIAIRISEVHLVRVYSFMSDPTALLFCLAIGAALLGIQRRTRINGLTAALISGVAIILQQTRAIYLSLPLALVLTIMAWGILVPAARSRLTRRPITGVLGIALLVGFLAVVAPAIVATYGITPLSRLNGVSSQVSSSTGNIGYRFNVAHDLLQLLGGRVSNWLTGLGFLDPRYRYFSGLPLGSIKNSDLGLVDGIMLVGMVGVAMIYSIAGILFWRVVTIAHSWQARLPNDAWLLFGIAAWITQVLLASYSLGTLFQEPGEILTALVIGVGLNTYAEYGSASAKRSLAVVEKSTTLDQPNTIMA